MKKAFKFGAALIVLLLAFAMFLTSCASTDEEPAEETVVEETKAEEAPAEEAKVEETKVEEAKVVDNNLLFKDTTTVLSNEMTQLNPDLEPCNASPAEVVTVTDMDGNEVQAMKFMPNVLDNGLEYRVILVFESPIKLYSKSSVSVEWSSDDEGFTEPFTVVSFFCEQSDSEDLSKSLLSGSSVSPFTFDFEAQETGWSTKLADSSMVCKGIEIFMWASDDPAAELTGINVTSIELN